MVEPLSVPLRGNIGDESRKIETKKCVTPHNSKCQQSKQYMVTTRLKTYHSKTALLPDY